MLLEIVNRLTIVLGRSSKVEDFILVVHFWRYGALKVLSSLLRLVHSLQAFSTAKHVFVQRVVRASHRQWCLTDGRHHSDTAVIFLFFSWLVG